MKKTLITAALVASMSLVAVACGDDADPTDEPVATEAAGEVTEAPAEEAAAEDEAAADEAAADEAAADEAAADEAAAEEASPEA